MSPATGFRGHLATALLVAGFAGGWLVFLLHTSGGLPSIGHSYRVRAIVPTAASLASHARVTMAGVEVGTVESVKRRGLGAEVTLELDDASLTPIPADSRIAIRQRTPIGENYVSISPGSSSAKLQSGGVLPASQGDEYVDVDQIFSILQGRTRQRARALMQSMGGALAGRGERLNVLLGGTAGTLSAGGRVATMLSHDRHQVGRLVEQLGDVTRAVGERGDAMRSLAREGRTTFQAIARRDASVRAMLAELPSTLGAVRGAAGTLEAVTGRAVPVIAGLAVAMRDLGPAVRHLRPAALQGRRVVGALGAAAPGIERTLGHVQALSRPASEALPLVGKMLCEVNPVLRYVKPYAPDLIGAVVGMGSGANSYDALGHLIRATPVITEQALTGLPSQVHEAALLLARTGLLRKTRQIGFDPHPPPGSIGSTELRGESILGPAQVKSTYPRVHADC